MGITINVRLSRIPPVGKAELALLFFCPFLQMPYN